MRWSAMPIVIAAQVARATESCRTNQRVAGPAGHSSAAMTNTMAQIESAASTAVLQMMKISVLDYSASALAITSE
jgi:glucokinase